MKYKVENKIGVIPDEKYRILYGGGLPPWHTLWIFNYFESFGAVFVIENVYRGYDPVEVPSHVKDPVDYLAWRAFLRFTRYHEKARAHSGNPTVEKLLDMIEDYKIDGVVFHACRSCRATTIGQTHIKSELGKYSSIPMMQLVSDMVDLRDYSEAQWKAQISAFIEALAGRGKSVRLQGIKRSRSKKHVTPYTTQHTEGDFMPFAGIDIGSTMTKVVIVDEKEKILASHIGPTGAEHRHLALKVMEETLQKAGLSFRTISISSWPPATAASMFLLPTSKSRKSPVMRAASALCFPPRRIIIDIGGQDSKGIKLDAEGKVANFVMNDKCAAGTGRFLEVIAETLGINLVDMGDISLKANGFVQISNMCTVFAEHEVTSRLAEGAGVAEIVAGLHEAIAGRVVNMTRHLGIEKDVVVTGGGAKNIGLVKAIEGKVGFPVLTPPEPFITGALGAALVGKDFYDRGVRPAQERRREEVKFFS